jgi:hypothetical protein
VDAAVLALLDAEFLPPRAPRFFGALLGIATPLEIWARMAFSVGAAGDGIAAADLTGAAALAAFAGALLRAVWAALDTARAGTGAFAGGAGCAPRVTGFGGALATAALLATPAFDEEPEEAEETELEEAEDETDDDEELDSEFELVMWTVCVTSWAGSTGERRGADDSDETEELEEPEASDADSDSEGWAPAGWAGSLSLPAAAGAGAGAEEAAALGLDASLTRDFLGAETLLSATCPCCAELIAKESTIPSVQKKDPFA